MFDTAPILWLQSWASPPLTTAMNAVTLLGYYPSCLAVAAIYALGWRLRRGVMVLIAVALAAVMTDAAKSTFRTPRPDRVDRRVQTLSLLHPAALDDEAGATGKPEDTFGFPSGHVAASSALVLALCLLIRRPAAIALAVAWIVLTAVARMYLGRHFVGDVAGGLLVGTTAVVLAWRLFGSSSFAASDERFAPARIVLTCLAVLAAVVAMSTPFLDPIDTGRFVGLVVAVIAIDRLGRLDDPNSVAIRVGRVAMALGAIGLTVWWMPVGTRLDAALRVREFVIAAALGAAALMVPVLVPRVSRP